MKILEMESSKGWGGQEKRTVRLNNNLSDEFEICWAVQPDSKLYKNKDIISGDFFPIRMRKTYDIKAILNLIKIVKNNNINIISTHSGKDAWLGSIVGKITNTPVVRTRHLSTHINSTLSYNLSDKVVCVSKQVRDYLYSQGIKKEKLKVIYTGVDTDRFKPLKDSNFRKNFGLKDDDFVIGIIAVLRAAKRHIDLLETIKDMDVKVMIVGNGPQEKNIKKFISENALEKKVLMLGHRDDIDKIVPNLDLFVLPSNMEALGTALLEAQACGVPVIGSNVGGIPECIADKKTGFLFEKENVNDLKEKISIIKNDKKLRANFSKEARVWVEENFSVKKMVEQTQELYMEMI